jgi:type I restriction enzyme M protein
MTEGRISHKELENYLWGAATLLRGVIDPGEYKSIIFPLMFFKRISDVYDEEYEKALEDSSGDEEYASFDEQHEFKIPKGAHWEDVRQSTKDVGKKIKKAMQEIEKANPDRLSGIFGDVNWANKNRLTDEILTDLIEHFSSKKLTIENVPQDEFGDAYEFLIKKFAEDSGHSAAEFYTNRTVVKVMAKIMNPQSGETIYDPTCGTGGMLLNSALLVKERGEEYRNMKLYGQEINIVTSGIARMNMFIHGIKDFEVIRGDTLKNSAFTEGDRLKKFDMVIANPPYSIKKWDQGAWKNDPYGRNKYGLPPKGNADYAFFQHIIASMKEDTGRSGILYPHGILERDSEKKIRQNIVEADLIECIVGLGKDLFYNSSMPSCLVFCKSKKDKSRKGKILFIDAKKELIEQRTQSFLIDENIKKIHNAYLAFKDIGKEPGKKETTEYDEKFARVVDIEEIKKNDYNLNIKLYIPDLQYVNEELLKNPLKTYISQWKKSREELKKATKEMDEAVQEVVKNGS